jgi:hypothetical protein
VILISTLLSVADIRTLIEDDDALQDGIIASLEDHNTEQLITVTLPESDQEVSDITFAMVLYQI